MRKGRGRIEDRSGEGKKKREREERERDRNEEKGRGEGGTHTPKLLYLVDNNCFYKGFQSEKEQFSSIFNDPNYKMFLHWETTPPKYHDGKEEKGRGEA